MNDLERSIIYVYISLLFCLENFVKILSQYLITYSYKLKKMLQYEMRNISFLSEIIQILSRFSSHDSKKKLLRIFLRSCYRSCENFCHFIATRFFQDWSFLEPIPAFECDDDKPLTTLKFRFSRIYSKEISKLIQDSR